MVSTRAPRVPADEARRRIVEAATTLLRGRRYRDLTVEDVMAEAGLSRTVFYRYFDGLPAVALALIADLVAAVVEEEAGSDDDRGAILRRQLTLVVRTFREHGPVLLALAAAAHADAGVEAAYRELLEQTIVEIEPMLPDDVRHATRPLSIMNAEYLLDLVATDPDFDEAEALEALWAVWSRTTLPQQVDS
jgi:AcrR family transcriptional regulator